MSSSDFVRHYTEDKASSHEANHKELIHNDGPIVVTADEVIGTSHCHVHVKVWVDKIISTLTFHSFIREIVTRAISLKNRLIELAVIRLRVIGTGENVPKLKALGLKGK